MILVFCVIEQGKGRNLKIKNKYFPLIFIYRLCTKEENELIIPSLVQILERFQFSF